VIGGGSKGEDQSRRWRVAEGVVQLGDYAVVGGTSDVVLAEREAAVAPKGDGGQIHGAAQGDFVAAGRAAALCEFGDGSCGVAAEAVIVLDTGLIDVQRAAGPGRAVEEKAAAVLMAINYQYVVSGIDAAALDCRRRDEAQGGALGGCELDDKVERIHDGVNLAVRAGGKVGPGGRLP